MKLRLFPLILLVACLPYTLSMFPAALVGDYERGKNHLLDLWTKKEIDPSDRQLQNFVKTHRARLAMTEFGGKLLEELEPHLKDWEQDPVPPRGKGGWSRIKAWSGWKRGKESGSGSARSGGSGRSGGSEASDPSEGQVYGGNAFGSALVASQASEMRFSTPGHPAQPSWRRESEGWDPYVPATPARTSRRGGERATELEQVESEEDDGWGAEGGRAKKGLGGWWKAKKSGYRALRRGD